MLKFFFNKRKIKKFARKLPQDLKAKYGYQKFYSKAQVDSAIKRKKIGKAGGIAVTENCYAYAMYCSPEEFKEIHDNVGENLDYAVMRGEISDTLFNGASDFTFSSLIVESSNAASSSFGGSSDSGTGNDGGFGGGAGE